MAQYEVFVEHACYLCVGHFTKECRGIFFVLAFVVRMAHLPKASSTAISHLSSYSSCVKCWSLCRILDCLIRVNSYFWN